MHAPLLALALLAEPAPPQNVALADLGLHVVGVGYQRGLAPWVALQLAAESYTPWTQNIDLLGLPGEADKSDLTGVVLRGRAFFYPLGTAPTGFWLSPFGQGGVGWATVAGQRQQGTLWAVGGSAGYGLLFGPIHLALGVGAQYHAARFASGGPNFGRTYPTLDASLGYAF